jgi:hypothetical protein
LDVLINGLSTGNAVPVPGYESFHDFSISGGFVPGVNTLDFLVLNGAGPTGLRVEMIGTAVPEPGGLMLFGVAAGGLTVFGWCRQRRGRDRDGKRAHH